MGTKIIKVWTSEERVVGAVTVEVANVFASLKGGLADAVNGFMGWAKPEYNHMSISEAETKAKESICALEAMALSLVSKAIEDATDRARAEIEQIKRLVEFEKSDSTIVYGHYAGDLRGHVWIKRTDEDRCPAIHLRLSDNDGHSLEKSKHYVTAGSFEAAYSAAISNRAQIVAAIEEMMDEWRKDNAEAAGNENDLG